MTKLSGVVGSLPKVLRNITWKFCLPETGGMFPSWNAEWFITVKSSELHNPEGESLIQAALAANTMLAAWEWKPSFPFPDISHSKEDLPLRAPLLVSLWPLDRSSQWEVIPCNDWQVCACSVQLQPAQRESAVMRSPTPTQGEGEPGQLCRTHLWGGRVTGSSCNTEGDHSLICGNLPENLPGTFALKPLTED